MIKILFEFLEKYEQVVLGENLKNLEIVIKVLRKTYHSEEKDEFVQSQITSYMTELLKKLNNQ